MAFGNLIYPNSSGLITDALISEPKEVASVSLCSATVNVSTLEMKGATVVQVSL